MTKPGEGEDFGEWSDGDLLAALENTADDHPQVNGDGGNLELWEEGTDVPAQK